MDRDELNRMLRRVGDEATDVQHQLVSLQERLDALMTTADGLRKLLGTMSPVAGQSPRPGQAAVSIRLAKDGTHATEPNGETPGGSAAARRILMSDSSRFWTVRAVWEEADKRSWDLSPDAMRIALGRLYERDPHVERVDKPVVAYRWKSELSAGS